MSTICLRLLFTGLLIVIPSTFARIHGDVYEADRDALYRFAIVAQRCGGALMFIALLGLIWSKP